MRLRVREQIYVKSVQRKSLRAGQEITVDDAKGAELLKEFPQSFTRLNAPAEEPTKAPAKQKA